MNLARILDGALGRIRLMPSIANTACCPDQITQDFTIAVVHLGTVVCAMKATTLTVTVPNDDDLPEAKAPIEVELYNHGDGDIALVAGEGVTFDNPFSVANPSFIRLKKRSANEWHIMQIQ